jgi:uncharacterized membrane protein YdbT with pleckstrin-like domain
MIDNLNWSERKRIWCGLPWTFTKYGLSDDRFFVEEGLFTTKQYDVRLYRILNISLSRTLIQKIFGLGTIHIDSTDKDLKCFEIENVKNSEQVKELISEAVEKERVRNRVTSREFLADSDDDHDDHSDY